MAGHTPRSNQLSVSRTSHLVFSRLHEPCYAYSQVSKLSSPLKTNPQGNQTHAITLTPLTPLPNFPSIPSANFSARRSILPLGGTAAVNTSTPLLASACVIPYQYSIPGNLLPAKCNSSKPKRPWARMIGFLGAS